MLLAIAGIYVALCLAGCLGYRVLLYPAPRDAAAEPPPGASLIELRASDGVSVPALHFPAPPVVHFHGNGETLRSETTSTPISRRECMGILTHPEILELQHAVVALVEKEIARILRGTNGSIRVLDVGCGTGALTVQLARWLHPRHRLCSPTSTQAPARVRQEVGPHGTIGGAYGRRRAHTLALRPKAQVV